MARRLNSIDEVDDSKETWKLAIRIMNIWCVDSKQGGNTEMLLIDEKGSKINAVVKNFDLDKLKSKLEEGKTYIVQNLEVQRNVGEFKICSHQYKLLFTKATIVKEQDLPTIPNTVYQFTNFADIINGQAQHDVLVDVIGEFADIVQYQLEIKPEKVAFLLKDQSGNTLNCTLWEEYANQLLNYLKSHEFGPIVILLTLAKIKDKKGKFPIGIQNSKFASKLIINANIVEIQQYKNGLDSSHVYESFSQKMTQISSSSQGPIEDFFSHNAMVKSVREINELRQECFCVTVGQIEKIFVANGWSYEGCSKCTRKGPSTTPYICAGCGKNNSEKETRFRIEVKVSHEKESSKFVLWDNECRQLLRQTAHDLKKQLIAEGELDPMAIPEAVDAILGKTLAFRVKVQPSFKQCSVVKVKEDQQTIDSMMQRIPSHEDTATDDKGKSVCSATKEDELYDSQSFSATADYDPDLLESLTPAKRSTSEFQANALGSNNLASAK